RVLARCSLCARVAVTRPPYGARRDGVSAPRLSLWTCVVQAGGDDVLRPSRRVGQRNGHVSGAAPAAPAEPLSPAEGELQRMKAALDLIGEGVVVYDAQGNLVFRNGPAERYLNSGPSDVLAAQAVADMLGHACAGEYREQSLDLVSPTR